MSSKEFEKAGHPDNCFCLNETTRTAIWVSRFLESDMSNAKTRSFITL